jgi:SGNH hydrolase-like domain, acetyltransferase AlgX
MESAPQQTAASGWSPSDLDKTVIGRRTAWVLACGFLSIIILIPLVDVLQPEIVRRDDKRSTAASPLRVFATLPALSDYPFPIHAQGQVIADPAQRFEQELEKSSWLRGQIRPWMHSGVTLTLRSSTTDVIMGSDSWLFFRPGVNHLVGPGFLTDHLGGVGAKTDGPLASIIAFHRTCVLAGATLVVVPINDKAAIESAHLSKRNHLSRPLENPDSTTWREQLTNAGVVVLPVTGLLQQRASDGDAFLRQDSHWTPATMLAVARRIAFHPLVTDHAGTRAWRRDPLTVSGEGDLARLLELPAGSSAVVPQTVQIAQVRDPLSGVPWASESTAPVLLLGDSFANIYQSSDLGWGEHAGLGAQLAFLLRTTIDIIAINGDGFDAPRKQLASRPSPLSGKRLVLWVFAERSLSQIRRH